MQALVLVGGEGTRLRPLTLTQPKPAIPLVDRPFIRFMLDWLARHGVAEVVLACGFKAEDLRAALGEDVAGGPAITYVEEDEPLGTAGPIRLAAERGLLGERFLVVNGDVLTDLDLRPLVAVHRDRGATASLALHPVADPSQYGLVRRRGGPPVLGSSPADPDGEVLGFVEKPGPTEIDTDEISAGVYLLESSVVELIPAGRAVSIEREVFPRLVGAGLVGRRIEGYWMDIGTPQRYLQATWDILEGAVATDFEGGGPLVDGWASLADDAEIAARAVIGAGCSIAAGACVTESVLHEGCRIGAGAAIAGSILARGVNVGARARVGAGSVIGEMAHIEEGAIVPPGSRVAPGETVAAGVMP